MKFITLLRNSLEKLIVEKNLYIIGEDIQQPYGGAFKVTKGLSDKFPDNIIATPMCEQGFAGLGVGMALMGENVIVEVMFGDFITLMTDQLINHAAKFFDIYGTKLHLVIRVPSGAYRGYGATHSQSLEKLYLGIPAIQIIAPSVLHNPAQLLEKALDTGCPTLFIENKLDYTRDVILENTEIYERVEYNSSHFPIVKLKVENEFPEWSIITYGGMVSMACDCMKQLFYDDEIAIEVIAVSDLNDAQSIVDKVQANNILIIEEGYYKYGWNAEIRALLLEQGKTVKRLGADLSFIPSGKKAEEELLVMPNDIISCCRGDN